MLFYRSISAFAVSASTFGIRQLLLVSVLCGTAYAHSPITPQETAPSHWFWLHTVLPLAAIFIALAALHSSHLRLTKGSKPSAQIPDQNAISKEGIDVFERTLDEVLLGSVTSKKRFEPDALGKLGRSARLINRILDRFQVELFRRSFEEENAQETGRANRLSTFSEGAFEGLIISHQGRVIETNRALCDLVSQTESEMIGRHLTEFIAPDSIEEALVNLKLDTASPYEIEIISSSGEYIPVEVRARTVEINGQKLRATAVRDIREQRAAHAQILHMAQHDLLTGLPNRQLLRSRLEKALKRQKQTNKPVAVLLIDIDRFKDINDLYGHPIGDKLIKTTAARLEACTEKKDTVARFGGDEFAILVASGKSRSQLGELAKKIQAAISEPIDVGNGILVRTTACIGIKIAKADRLDPDALLANADIALYRVKDFGRNKISFFQAFMAAEVALRRTMEDDLRLALEKGQFEVHYQAQARTMDRKTRGFEALLRWNHPTKGAISPAQFIPIAEETGLIVPIGRWVIEQACQAAAQWPQTLRVSVNLSPVQFYDDQLIPHIEYALLQSGLEAHRLEVEVTESILIEDDARTLSALNKLKELGVTIALDDFGTGYSSLSYLRRFPFDRLKIDRSFISGITHTPEYLAIIRAVIDLGHALGMEVIAEGVETEAEVALLHSERCDEIQGYLIGRPKPLSALEPISDTFHYADAKAGTSKKDSNIVRALESA
ncbi:EAL domain-containing protein [Rhodobacteraceae bacterium RKSG542]|uniref:putative bifunctional diguanylate cyclase/phosphodiesterase n=1 Tax=Pseudovibrio flavus TaxID=2529854 RepID=UPI0012BC14E6|nr:EAL domain-containing protein [Pseudovibrio flavus]MTI19104.1 EAL domain-containing protein [Pseudovibrio flavus]